MRKLCLLVFASLIAFPVLSQSEKGYVYLKNGSRIKGKYWYSNDMSKINIRSSGNNWVFDSTEIDSITSNRWNKNQSTEPDNPFYNFFFRSEVGFLLGNDKNNQTAPLSFTTSINYSFYPKMSVGVGVGVELLDESYLPVYANFEYKFRESYSTPYVFFKAGYQVPLEDNRMMYPNYYPYPTWSSFAPWPDYDYSEQELEIKGGVLVNPGLGYQRMFSNNFGMSVAFGYQYHRLNFKSEEEYSVDIDYNRLTFKIGIIFN